MSTIKNSAKHICAMENAKTGEKYCKYAVCGITLLTTIGWEQGVPFFIDPKTGRKMTGSSKFCDRHKKHEAWWPRCSLCKNLKVSTRASGKTAGCCDVCIEAEAHIKKDSFQDPILDISSSSESGWSTVVKRNVKKETTTPLLEEPSEEVKAARALLAQALAAEAEAAAVKKAEAAAKQAQDKKIQENRSRARQYVMQATNEQIQALIEFIDYVPVKEAPSSSSVTTPKKETPKKDGWEKVASRHR